MPVACSVPCKEESVPPYLQELPVSGLYLLSVQCSPMLAPTSRAAGSLLAFCSLLCEGRYSSLFCCEQNPQGADFGQGLGELGESGFVESSAVG